VLTIEPFDNEPEATEFATRLSHMSIIDDSRALLPKELAQMDARDIKMMRLREHYMTPLDETTH
jgi:hypothetical protein